MKGGSMVKGMKWWGQPQPGDHYDVIAPDLLLPSQYVDMHTGGSQTPELRLVLAVLTDALQIWQRGHDSLDARRWRLYNDAAGWFEDTSTAPFSFEWVCDALAIDVGALRKRLAASEVGHIERRTLPRYQHAAGRPRCARGAGLDRRKGGLAWPN